MHRMLLWRMGFEIKNVQRVLGRSNGTVKYFAFGANLDPAVLRQRRISAIDEKPFVLTDHELQFTHPGAFAGMGFASIEKAPGKVVYGKLYTLSRVDAERMDFYELVPILRRYCRVAVEQDGEEFYFYQSCDPRPGLKPTKKYLSMLLNGFEKAPHVPASFLNELAATETLESLVPASDLNFLVRTDRWPVAMRDLLRAYDSTAVKLFLKHVKDRSFTERKINVL